MGIFRFPLGPLLEQARQQEAQEREAFDVLHAGLQLARNELTALECEFEASAAAGRTTHGDARLLQMSYGCAEEIARRIEGARVRIETCEQSCDVARARVLQCRALRKSLETLQSRQLARHRQNRERLEERELEEVNATRMTVIERR